MQGFIKARCNFCRRQFYKENRHFNWSKKLGHNLFCSKKCHYKSKLRGKILSCENPECDKNFYRSPNNISVFNYCSKSCAAVVNNSKYPKWPKRFCSFCKKEFKNRDSKYCSNKCGNIAIGKYRSLQSKYTKKQMTSSIKNFYKVHGRVPAKREVLGIVSCATSKFGSWNKAVTAAGLRPHRSHDDRMYKRSKTTALDGHKCDSMSEATIDNWLAKNKIAHDRNASYPNTKHKSDWIVGNGKVFVEYFGLAKDSPRYDRAIKEKKQICLKHKIKLIEIYPTDLYPKMLLDKKLSIIK